MKRIVTRCVTASASASCQIRFNTGSFTTGKFEPDQTNPMYEEQKYNSGASIHPEVHPVGITLENPLPKEELQQHQVAEREWMEYNKRIEAAREEGDERMLEVIAEGLALSKGHGPDLRRPGYDALLNLEALKIHKRHNNVEAALAASTQAEVEYTTDNDKTQQMFAQLQSAKLRLLMKMPAEAKASFEEVLEHSTAAAATGSPMAQMTAQRMAPECKLGIAQAHAQQGDFDAAHTLLGKVLPHFAGKEDVEETWECLELAEACFRGMDNMESVKKALERQLNWAKRFKLDDKLPEVEKKLAAL